MKTIYSTSFELTSPQTSGEPLQNQIGSEVATWIREKCQRAWQLNVDIDQTGCRLTPDAGHSIIVSLHREGDSEIRDFEWTHPGSPGSGAVWTNSLSLARNNEKVAMSLSVKLSSLQFVLKPVVFDFGIPNIIRRTLSRYSCSIDGWRIPTGIRFLTVNHVESFVNESLFSSFRKLPVLVITDDSWTGRPLVEPQDYHQALIGLAEVVVLDKWGSFQMTDIIGKDLSCFGGAVRVYWPGFRANSRPFDHPLFLPLFIGRRASTQLPLEKMVFRRLCAISVTRHVDGPVLIDARANISAAERQKNDALRQSVERGLLEKTELTDQLLDALIRNEQLQKDKEALQMDLDAQRTAWGQYQSALVVADEEDDLDEPVSEPSSEFENVLAAYDQATSKFGGKDSAIVFLDRARESAADSPYQNPAYVYALFEKIGELAARWSSNKGKLGQGWREALRSYGFEYKDKISDTSLGKYGDEYKFVYGTKKVLFDKHVTLGAKQPQTCLSVHWYLDETKWKLVVGHCGRHLSNTRS